ncbi:MmcQ/YjbR family DNA-binding protein [Arthrobacter sp. zg-Y20]|uniref:MmcQ/YjbR family DNA-binding protein n=1 Tax=unclassified Arthrobacter TaxID=235627 RepID=UPI001D151340|nr:MULTISPECIES: MmcQ/YjbR family DNA-binding protein [unclassified Arthrobacter]MCC3275692.1 MmcQ/YjbR family DNA-binding protein [Arthrobacter sp. zg-Y20]MDK1315849.1 MmcQ/YjbR family DNA-binding protein [Arthrobacter sp. zg.Y20]WIB06366.1 MmcQ/YjbR family DNA-binding protein [Arthrobacter sp. zg-Y20]
MDARELRQMCLALPGAFEDFPFGPETSVFKVRAAGGRAKMFAMSSLQVDPLLVSLKCEPELALQLRAAHPEITGAWHMNKTHWNQVEVAAGLARDMIRDLVEDSYDLVVASLPKKDRESLAWKGLAEA